MQVVRASPSEARRLTQIAFAAKRYWKYPEQWIAVWAPLLTITPEFIAGHEVYELLVDDQVVGFYALGGQGPKLKLEHLWIVPQAIGKGHGRTLFEHAVNRAGQLGANALEIESDPNARIFYERMGARQVGEHVTRIGDQLRRLPVLILFIHPSS
jgi:GNAT superfamily N-acetyltransferase